MPNGSLARIRSPLAWSSSAKANIPRNRGSAAGPQQRQASSTTSVSDLVVKATPRAISSSRSAW